VKTKDRNVLNIIFAIMIMALIENRTKRNLPMRNATCL